MPYTDWTGDFMAALHDAVRAAWPEVIPTADGGGGIFESLEVGRISAEAIGFPRAIMDIQPGMQGRGSMTSVTYEQEVFFYYVDLTDGGATEAFRSRLKALQDELRINGLSHGGTAFTVLQRFRTYAYAKDLANRILLIRNNDVQAAALAATFLVGDDAN